MGSTMRTTTRAGTEGSGRRSARAGSLGPVARRSRGPWLGILKWLIGLAVFGVLAAGAAVVFVFWLYGRELPDGSKLSDYRPKQLVEITDSGGRRIGELFDERRTVVAFDKVPPIVGDAFVAAEDNRFWNHAGIDYVGMLRAFVANLRPGHSLQGASTITQQVVKGLLLTPARTFRRKIQEIILARRIEQSLTKQEILGLYMNVINFGAGRYGVEEAARYYFGKHVGQLNVGEAAMLAGIPQSPENISPRKPRNAKRAKDRQTYVLNQLLAMQKISAAEAQKWIDAPIQIVPFTDEAGAAPEWVSLAERELLKQHGGDRAQLFDTGGTIRTTLDSSLQAVAQKALQTGLRAIDKRHGIGRAIRSVKSEKLEAELGKFGRRLPKGGPQAKEAYDAIVTEVFDDDKELAVDLGDWKAGVLLGGESDARWNPPDGDGKVKKPSERFKPGDVVSVMLPASEAVARPNDDDDDEPKAKPKKAIALKHAKRRVVLAPGPEGAVVIIDVKTRKVRALVGGFASKVGGFNRATMAHRQPGSSFKPVVYSAAIDSGKYTPATVVNDVQETYANIPGWKPKNFETGKNEGPVRLRYALSKSINSVSLQLVENVKPQTVVALAKRMGIASNLNPDMSIALGSNEVTPLENTNAAATLAAGGIAAEPQFIESIDGKVVAPPPGEQVLRPEVAYVVIDMMRSVVNEGTATAAKVLNIPIAGKTGTSNDAKDTWFIGLTPDYAIGVWIGYDDPRPMGKETGGSNAVPVYVDIMKQMNQPAKSFARPPHVVEATIDRATGLLAPDGAPKASTLTEVFLEGSQPTEVAPMPDDVTADTKTKSEYEY